MFKQTDGARHSDGARHCLPIGMFIMTLAVAITFSGCKKATSQPSSSGTSESKNLPASSQAPAKADNSIASDTAQSHTIAPAENKKNLVDIIRAARSWGPAREFMQTFGKEAPDFTLTDINGKTHKLSAYRGKNVIIIFWATWCPPCEMEVPHLKELRETFSKDKLAILSMSYISSYPPNTAKMIKDFAVEKKLNYTVFAVESGNAGYPYDNVNGIPTCFFIDSEGKIKVVTSGLMPLNDLKAILEAQWPEGAV